MIFESQRQRTILKLSFLVFVLIILWVGFVLYNMRYRADILQTQNVKAFPTCEGYGCATTTGGRGGSVYAVTNLNDSGEGSFRWAATQGTSDDARTVIFRIGGVIEANSPIIINPNTTIAGQTAPGDGITLKGTIKVVDNTIVRYLRIRPGEISDGDALEIIGSNNIIDHCSISWANDEAIGFKRNQDMSTTEPPIDRNVTIQWSLLGEEEKGILAWFGHKTSIHHNLFAHHDYRSPNTAGGSSHPYSFDVVNNVIYDVSDAASQAPGAVNLNYVNNYTVSPRSSRDHVYSLVIDDDNTTTKVYAEGNIGPHTRSGDLPWNEVRGDNGGPATESIHRIYEKFETPTVTTYPAEQAFELVLNQSGASIPKRDPIDERMVDRTRAGTYSNVIRDPATSRSLAAASWQTLNYQTAPPPLDNDGDGISDNWEIANGLNPSDPSDSRIDSNNNGYTNIEEYTFEFTGEEVGGGSPEPKPLPEPNNPPLLTNPGDKTVVIGNGLNFTLKAEDLDGDTLSYSSNFLPDGAVLDSASGEFYWIASEDQAGSHIVQFTVSDGQDSDTESITITVEPGEKTIENQPPVLEEIGNFEVTQGDKIELTIVATDPDNDEITYSSNSLPAGAILDQVTGLFEWIPSELQKGDYLISFDANDGEMIDSKTSIITVNETPNSAPILSPIGNKEIKAGESLNFRIQAIDSDNDNLHYSTSKLPEGATFDSNTQEFYWAPTPYQTGIYFVTFSVTDNFKGDYEIININVADTPVAEAPIENTEPEPANSPDNENEPIVKKEKRIRPPKNIRVNQDVEKQLVKLTQSPEEKTLIQLGIEEILFNYKDVNLPSYNLLDTSYYRLLRGRMFDPVVKISVKNAEQIQTMELIILINGKELTKTILRKSDDISETNRIIFLADESISLNRYGTYQFYLKINEDQNIGMIKDCLVDPAGYIYYQNHAKEEIRIADARVTLERKEGDKFIVWNAQEFGQVNPQITKEDGEYAFLVPAGTYRLLIEKDGFSKVETESFSVDDQLIIKNIEMQKKYNIVFIVIVIGLSLLIVSISTWLILKRRARIAIQPETENSENSMIV